MSATPRTDEVTLGEFEYGRDYDGNYQVAALDYEVLRDHARQLERDCAVLKQAASDVFNLYFDENAILRADLADANQRIREWRDLLEQAEARKT